MKKILYFVTPNIISTALLADEVAAQGRQQSMWSTFMMIGIALLFFYLILWRPEQKRRKKMEQQRSTMSKGDRVTAMGIVGTLAKVNESTVILKMVDGAKIEVLKNAISDVQPSTNQNSPDISSVESNSSE